MFGERSHKKVSASLQTYAWNRFTTRCIKRSIYRWHVVRYKFSLSRVLSNELAVLAKLRRKLRFVAGGERLNSQILPRDFPRKRCVGEKGWKSSTESWKYLCMLFFSFLHKWNINDINITINLKLSLRKISVPKAKSLYIIILHSYLF